MFPVTFAMIIILGVLFLIQPLAAALNLKPGSIEAKAMLSGLAVVGYVVASILAGLIPAATGASTAYVAIAAAMFVASYLRLPIINEPLGYVRGCDTKEKAKSA